ncbi:MAG: hypothetical protein IJS96_04590 [Schwartzia sp.]|nr:hypothetical protein [Schwartzia sp. (in: firmicutes)]
MTALRQEALQLVNAIPEPGLEPLVQYIRNYQKQYLDEQTEPIRSQITGFTDDELKEFVYGDGMIDPKKEAAFMALEAWRKRNKANIPADFDAERELMEALDEKYGPVD